jgi:hypothetical protein
MEQSPSYTELTDKAGRRRASGQEYLLHFGQPDSSTNADVLGRCAAKPYILSGDWKTKTDILGASPTIRPFLCTRSPPLRASPTFKHAT